MTTINPCPFCGFDDVEIDEVDCEDGSEFAVDCPNCRAVGPICDTVMVAISFWNDRRGQPVAETIELKDAA